MAQSIIVQGVLDDGSIFDPRTPRNTATTIQFPRKADVSILVPVENNAGVPIRFSDDLLATAVMHITRRLSVDGCREITKTIAAPIVAAQLPNVLGFTLDPADTAILYPGRYWFDVWLYWKGKEYQIVRASALHVEPSIG